MTQVIRSLSEQTINQIAAGEVIENPASVVKELVENGIDAGARHLTIEIVNGGFESIRISDDGCGMSPADAELSFERHTTSKIIQPEDLWTLSTMGFRGEALASIASISHMEILTSTGDRLATHLTIEGGKKLSCIPASRVRGTTIEVRSLFYNTPARKAFQKSASASSAEITKTLTHLALAHPRVGFTLIQQKKEIFSCLPRPSSPLAEILQERASLLLHSEFTDGCTPFIFTEPEVQGIGLLGDPTKARQNRSGQYLFINHRPIQSLSLSFCVQEAYGTMISNHTHPLYLLHLTIPPSLVDVNVHPQKKEVRLHSESLVRYALKTAVKKALGSPVIQETACYTFFSPFPLPSASPQMRSSEALLPSLQQPLRLEFSLQPISLYKHYLLVHADSLPWAFPPGIALFDLKRCVAKLFASECKTAPFVSQKLLLSQTLAFSLTEMQILLPKLPLLCRYGLEIEQGGKQTLLVSAISPRLSEEQIRPLLLDLIAEKKEDEEVLLALVAERISLSTRNYTCDEGIAIVRKLIDTQDPHHCPRGRPTYFLLKEADLERRFTQEASVGSFAKGALF